MALERTFENGKMIVKRDGEVVREVTVEQLEQRKARIEDWIAQAQASA